LGLLKALAVHPWAQEFLYRAISRPVKGLLKALHRHFEAISNTFKRLFKGFFASPLKTF